MDGIDLGRQGTWQVETLGPPGNHQVHAILAGTESFRDGAKAGRIRPGKIPARRRVRLLWLRGGR